MQLKICIPVLAALLLPACTSPDAAVADGLFGAEASFRGPNGDVVLRFSLAEAVLGPDGLRRDAMLVTEESGGQQLHSHIDGRFRVVLMVRPCMEWHQGPCVYSDARWNPPGNLPWFGLGADRLEAGQVSRDIPGQEWNATVARSRDQGLSRVDVQTDDVTRTFWFDEAPIPVRLQERAQGKAPTTFVRTSWMPGDPFPALESWPTGQPAAVGPGPDPHFRGSRDDIYGVGHTPAQAIGAYRNDSAHPELADGCLRGFRMSHWAQEPGPFYGDAVEYVAVLHHDGAGWLHEFRVQQTLFGLEVVAARRTTDTGGSCPSESGGPGLSLADAWGRTRAMELGNGDHHSMATNAVPGASSNAGMTTYTTTFDPAWADAAGGTVHFLNHQVVQWAATGDLSYILASAPELTEYLVHGEWPPSS